MKSPDIRWIQRLDSYGRALEKLEAAVTLASERPLSELEQQGLIQGFEFTHELAWNLLKDFLTDRGAIGIYGSRDAVREAFSSGLIENGEVWMRMIASRNLSIHTYNRSVADSIATAVIADYLPAFRSLRERMVGLASDARE